MMRLWEILKLQERTPAWLARQTGYHYSYLYNLKAGRRKATARFKAACAEVLKLPEDLLFPPEDDPVDRLVNTVNTR